MFILGLLVGIMIGAILGYTFICAALQEMADMEGDYEPKI